MFASLRSLPPSAKSCSFACAPLIAIGLWFAPVSLANAEVAYTEVCRDVAFRETPYADIKCAGKTDVAGVGAAKHFVLDYDNAGRLIEVRHVQGDILRAYSDRFVRAPRTKISYDGDIETRIYFNEFGHRTVVSGDVYETQIKHAENGDRLKLEFFDIHGNPTENDFAIASYEWTTKPKGDVVETRRRLDGSIQRNRPGFGYLITKFSYDARGMLRRMTNLGEAGTAVTADDAGIVATQIGYDQNGRFTQWLNLDANGSPKRGLSAIAEIQYKPSPFRGEQVATFVDADGSPQTTRWGAHIVDYEFDEFGNETLRRFFDVDGAPVNAANGVGRIVSRWSRDGAHRVSRAYFNKDGEPTGVTEAAIHAYITELDNNDRPVRTRSVNTDGDVVVDPNTGFAKDETLFDKRGRIIERRFLDADDNLADHATWGVARFEYGYNANNELTSVRSFTKEGVESKPIWNPAH